MLGGGESMWASMGTWFTPTVLFCVMNLMIGTIFIASNNNNKRHDHDPVEGNSSSRIDQVSSLLERVKSIKFSSYTTTAAANLQLRYPFKSKTTDCSSSSPLAQSIHLPSCFKILREFPTRKALSESRRSMSQPIPASSILERVKSNILSLYSTVSKESEQLQNSAAQIVPKSFKSGGPSTQPDHHVIRSKSIRPCVMKKSLSEMRIASESDDEEDVDWRRPATTRESRNKEDDAKADDFISRFKKQLKLQRVESLVRFKEMLNRGT